MRGRPVFTAADRSGSTSPGAARDGAAPRGSRSSTGPSGCSTTLSGSATTTSYSARGRAHASPRFLKSIHWSCLSSGFEMRTSSQRPASFWPCSLNSSLPLAMPSCGSPTGSQVPLSQTMTFPAPYCFGGITPSKLP